jgi:putative ATPase
MQPLADRLRPTSLDEYIGQNHILGNGKVLRSAIEKGTLPSFILWGPPGVGKTTLANIIARITERHFLKLSAINSGVKDIRESIEKAKKQAFFNRPSPILFIDEIHRFSKSQQDALLGAVESGTVTLIGATTENPSFEVIPALLSRCQVYTLKHHNEEELELLLKRAIEKDVVLKDKSIKLNESKAIKAFSGGDARKLLNILELVVSMAKDQDIIITDKLVEDSIKENTSIYDKSGEQHYDIASAFIKSIRGSDPQAAVYWLARMLQGGEDIKFIARRLVISASEDIGLANPNALLMANTAFDACEKIGMPEARIILSQATIYLATSPKSNSAYLAINEALNNVKSESNLTVPLHLRNAPTKLMKELGYGASYKYAHDFKDNFTEQEFLPKEIKGKMFYEPAANPAEQRIKDTMKKFWENKYDY